VVLLLNQYNNLDFKKLILLANSFQPLAVGLLAVGLLACWPVGLLACWPGLLACWPVVGC